MKNNNQGSCESIVFWDCDADTEVLRHETVDEAVTAFIEELGSKDVFGILDEPLSVYGYERMEPDELKYGASVLDFLLESIDETYGNPEGNPYDVTKEMKDASEVFVKTVIEEYSSWACEPVTEIKVNVREWVKKIHPEWMEKLREGEGEQ